MSHFTILVAVKGEDAFDAYDRLDDALAPFDENMDVPHDEWVDQAEVERAVAFYREHPEFCDGVEGPPKPFDQYVTEGNLEAFDEWTRQAVGGYGASNPERGLYDREAHRFGYRSSYNPKSKWDWHQLGGRWHGFFQVKPGVKVGSLGQEPWRLRVSDDRVFGDDTIPRADETCTAILGRSGTFGDDPSENFTGRADLVRKGDIDFEAARILAAQQAELAYDKFEEATKGLEVPPTWAEHLKKTLFDHDLDPDTPHSEMTAEEREKHDAAVNEARTTYHEYPWIQALRAANMDVFLGDSVEYYKVREGGRQAFVETARLGTGRTFALLIDGVWYEKGEMGWFGMASNEKDEETWARQYWRIIDSLPDDVYLACVDAHI